MKRIEKRGGAAESLFSANAISENAFLLLCIVAFIAFGGLKHELLNSPFIPLLLSALFLGVLWTVFAPTHASLLFLPAIWPSLYFLPYAVLGAIGRFPASLLMAAAFLIVFAIAVIVRKSRTRALIAAFLAAELVGSWLSLSVLTPKWPGSCSGPYDALLSSGGVLSDKENPYAIQCDKDGNILYISYPNANEFIKIVPASPNLSEPASLEDTTTAMNIDPESEDLMAPFIKKHFIALHQSSMRYLAPMFPMGPGRCELPVAVDKDIARGTFLTLCADSRLLDIAKGWSPGASSQILDVARFPSGLAVSKALERGYITDLFGWRMRVLDLKSSRTRRMVYVGLSASGAAISPDGTRVFIGRPLSSRVDIFDAESLEKVGERPAGFGVGLLRMQPEGHFLFEASPFAGTIAIWSLVEERLLGPYKVGRPIHDMTFCRESRRLYFTTPCGVGYLDLKLLKD